MIHEEWYRPLSYNDIALIKLPIDVNFNEYIQPAKLPSPIATYDGSLATTSGWGRQKYGKYISQLIIKILFSTAIFFIINRCFRATNSPEIL